MTNVNLILGYWIFSLAFQLLAWSVSQAENRMLAKRIRQFSENYLQQSRKLMIGYSIMGMVNVAAGAIGGISSSLLVVNDQITFTHVGDAFHALLAALIFVEAMGIIVASIQVVDIPVAGNPRVLCDSIDALADIPLPSRRSIEKILRQRDVLRRNAVVRRFRVGQGLIPPAIEGVAEEWAGSSTADIPQWDVIHTQSRWNCRRFRRSIYRQARAQIVLRWAFHVLPVASLAIAVLPLLCSLAFAIVAALMAPGRLYVLLVVLLSSGSVLSAYLTLRQMVVKSNRLAALEQACLNRIDVQLVNLEKRRDSSQSCGGENDNGYAGRPIWHLSMGRRLTLSLHVNPEK